MRSNLEIFLLALVQAGIRTPYEMMSKADVSIGSSLPALNRMEIEGLLHVSPGPARGSKVFDSTGDGRRALHREWRKVAPITGEDLDSVLRTASLIWAREGKVKCSTYLKAAGARLKARRDLVSKAAEELSRSVVPGSHLADRYRFLRRSLEAKRLQAEVEVLFDLSRRISPRGKSRKSGDPNRENVIGEEKA